MKNIIQLIRVCLLCALYMFCLASPVQAHGEHGKPQYGGLFGEAGLFQTELLVHADKVVLYLTEHGQPLASQGGSAKLTVLSGVNKSELTLTAVGDNRFEAKLAQALATGSKVVATVMLADKRSATARFVLP